MVELFFNSAGNYVRIKYSGKASNDDLRDACEAALADERYKAGMGRIWDVRSTDLSGISSQQVKLLTSYLADRPDDINNVRVAIVADSPLGFGLARVFATVSESTAKNEVMPFRSLEEAEAWVAGKSLAR